jgi:RNA polymerase sigma-70 factor (ECF subfamily)
VTRLNIEEVSREYFARIHRAALVLTGNPWDADDLAQETFLVVARQSQNQNQNFEGRSSVYTYLYGILLNLERRERRRHGVRRRKLQVLWDNEPSGEKTIPAAETAIEVSEWKKSLWARVAKLPDGQRQALVLRFSEGLRYDEIAEALGCPLGTVKSRIYHGLLGLRRTIEEEGEKKVGEDVRQLPAHPFEDLTRAI